jgi:hypothetical protein
MIHTHSALPIARFISYSIPWCSTGDDPSCSEVARVDTVRQSQKLSSKIVSNSPSPIAPGRLLLGQAVLGVFVLISRDVRAIVARMTVR